ncbi:MAG: DUF5919 domain-containing protein [Prevotellaceae bacterium]|nr:DUF5919 domain-containing protein [Prevotellaceae bacterium]
MGISLKSIFNNEDIDSLIGNKCDANKNFKFKFLVLNPDSKYLEEKAKEEGGNPDEWKLDIQKTIIHLKRLKNINTSNIEIKMYDSLPIWRCIFMDNKCTYVSFYVYGSNGKKSPEFIISDTSNYNLYLPLRKTFDELWNNGIDA